MADRLRRKSSILKVPKNVRAPLQDVNNLEVKPSQDDDVTAHSANLRRRVSFAGKNFVKEFCSEADMKSFHHAVEYEQEWLASTDSSGLVMSDTSNNTHSNTALSITQVTQTRFQFPEENSTNLDINDPCKEIMREIFGEEAPIPQKVARQNRYSFGEIQVPDLYLENVQDARTEPADFRAIAKESNTSKPQSGNFTSNEIDIQNENLSVDGQLYHAKVSVHSTLQTSQGAKTTHLVDSVSTLEQGVQSLKPLNTSSTSVQDAHTVLSQETISVPPQGAQTMKPLKTSSISVQDARTVLSQETISVRAQGAQINRSHGSVLSQGVAATESAKSMEVQKVASQLVNSQTTSNNVMDTQGMNYHQLYSTSVGSDMLTPSSVDDDDNDVFESTSVPSNGIADKTNFDTSGMDFTTPIPGLIQCGPQTPSEKKDVTSALLQNKSVQDDVNLRQSAMQHNEEEAEVMQRRQFNICTGIPNDEHPVNTTQILEESMEFTRAVPGSIQLGYILPAIAENIGPATNILLGESKFVSSESETTHQSPQCHLRPESSISRSNTISFGSELCESREAAFNSHKDITEAMEVQQGANDMRRNISSNVPITMSASMEFTQAVPGNIHTEFHSQDMSINVKRNESVASHSKSQMMSTSTSNIQFEIEGRSAADGITGEENSRCNHTQVMTTSLDISSAASNNVVFDFDKEKEMEANDNTVGHSKTQLMCTSMEFTRPMPTNIQVHSESVPDATVSSKEQEQLSKTLFLCTSMELTKPMPGIITLSDPSIGQQTAVEASLECNGTPAMCASVELAKPPLGHFQGACNDESNIAVTEKETSVHNHAQVRSTSVESTRPLPAHITTNIEDMPAPEQHCNEEESLDVHNRRNVSMNQRAGSGNSNWSKSLSDIEAQAKNKSMEVIQSGQDEKNQNTQFSTNAEAAELVHSPLKEDQNLSNDQTGRGSLTKASDVTMKISSDVGITDTLHVRNRQNSNERHILSTVVSSASSSELQSVLSISYDSIANPFQSRPCVIFSPPKLSGIASLAVQMCPREQSIHDGLPLCNRRAINTSGDSCIASVPKDISQEEVSHMSTNINDSNNRSERNLPLQHPTVQGKEPIAPQDCTPNPFKSIPQITVSPGHVAVSESHARPVKEQSEVDVGGAAEEEIVHTKSCLSNSLAVAGEKPLLLLDVPPPFPDISTNSSVDMSANVSDSVVNMLHTTIRNAEITLREMHSPDSWKNTEELSNSAKETHIPCSPTQTTQTKSSPRKQARHNSILDCSPENQSNEDASEFVVGLKPTKRDRDLSFNGERSHEEPNAKKASQTSDSKCSKRSFNSSLDSDEEMSDHTRKSLKRSCKSNLTGSRQDQPSKYAMVSVDSDLEISEASTNCSSALLNTISASQDLDEIILESQRRYPRYWEATKIINDIWSFKFMCTELELRVQLKPSSQARGNIEAFNGRFISNVTESTKPAIKWGMSILMKNLSTEEWRTIVQHSTNFLLTLQEIIKEVIPVRKFIVETIIQQGRQNLKFSENSLSFSILSHKCLLWFKVTLKMDSWDKISPEHISVTNIIGETREQEVKKLVTGVKKDIYILRNYVRDVNDYVKTLEGFCK